jgi:protein gp37
MADVFEDRRDLDSQWERLWQMIKTTPWLDWLLLTKRPEHVEKLAPWAKAWPTNVWLGVTVENQTYADLRVPLIANIPAVVRFASCEPLLDVLDLTRWLAAPGSDHGLNWVIAGGESGPCSRPMNPVRAQQLRDHCLEARVPFHFKQWGYWGPASDADIKAAKSVEVFDHNNRPVRLFKPGKHVTGRSLDGEIWNGFSPVGINRHGVETHA